MWNLAASDSEWFTSSFMINYRVDDLGALLDQLRGGGVEIVKGPESHENGRFAWIMDPDGNKLELWEPKLWDEKKLTQSRLKSGAAHSRCELVVVAVAGAARDRRKGGNRGTNSAGDDDSFPRGYE